MGRKAFIAAILCLVVALTMFYDYKIFAADEDDEAVTLTVNLAKDVTYTCHLHESREIREINTYDDGMGGTETTKELQVYDRKMKLGVVVSESFETAKKGKVKVTYLEDHIYNEYLEYDAEVPDEGDREYTDSEFIEAEIEFTRWNDQTPAPNDPNRFVQGGVMRLNKVTGWAGDFLPAKEVMVGEKWDIKDADPRALVTNNQGIVDLLTGLLLQSDYPGKITEQTACGELKRFEGTTAEILVTGKLTYERKDAANEDNGVEEGSSVVSTEFSMTLTIDLAKKRLIALERTATSKHLFENPGSTSEYMVNEFVAMTYEYSDNN